MHGDMIPTRNQLQRHRPTIGDLRRAKLARRAARERYRQEQLSHERWCKQRRQLRKIFGVQSAIDDKIFEQANREELRRNIIFAACMITLWAAIGVWAYMQPVTP